MYVQLKIQFSMPIVYFYSTTPERFNIIYNTQLITAGANVQATTKSDDTALHFACEQGHNEIAALLLQHGAELEYKTECGRTPLMKAARAGHLETVKMLVEEGLSFIYFFMWNIKILKFVVFMPGFYL